MFFYKQSRLKKDHKNKPLKENRGNLLSQLRIEKKAASIGFSRAERAIRLLTEESQKIPPTKKTMDWDTHLNQTPETIANRYKKYLLDIKEEVHVRSAYQAFLADTDSKTRSALQTLLHQYKNVQEKQVLLYTKKIEQLKQSYNQQPDEAHLLNEEAVGQNTLNQPKDKTSNVSEPFISPRF